MIKIIFPELAFTLGDYEDLSLYLKLPLFFMRDYL